MSKGILIEEFIGVKSKTYSIRYADGTEEQKNSGIRLHNLKHEQCILGEDEKQSVTVTSIRSEKHEVFTERLQKVALMNYDNKSFMIDNLNSVPYGHKNIPQIMKYQTDYFEFFHGFNF